MVVGIVLADIDCCFHEAGMVSVDRSIEAPAECHAVNAGATVSLLEAARRADLSKARRDLGYEPETDLSDGLAALTESSKQRTPVAFESVVRSL
jgi:nucleoside-diphosphate-sugar epimerase